MNRLNRFVRNGIAGLVLAGTTFQAGGCDLLGGVGRTINQFNPCLTILVCDPALFNFARSGIDGPGVRPDVDPFCTFAPFCGNEDPIFGNLANGQP